MTSDCSRRTFLGGAAGVVVTGLAGCTAAALEAESTMSASYDAAELAVLDVAGTNGDITISSADIDQIEVTGEKQATTDRRLDDITLESDRADGTLSLTVDLPDTDGFLKSLQSEGRIDLTITVPSRLEAVVATTVNGDITGTAHPGSATLSTVNGDVRWSGSDLAADVETTNGDISLTADSIGGDIAAETTNGDVSVTVPPDVELAVDATSTTGSVAVTGGDGDAAQSVADLELATVNGDIDVRTG